MSKEQEAHIARLEAQIEILKSLIVDMRTEQKQQPIPSNIADTRLFTPKQHVVLQMLHAGYSNLQIADRLEVAESTVKVHVKAIMDKLGVRSRSQVVIKTQDIMALGEKKYLEATAVPIDWYKNGADEMVDRQIMTKTR